MRFSISGSMSFTPHCFSLFNSSEMQTSKTHSVELGLKVLTVCHERNHSHHNSCIMNSTMLSPPARSSSSMIGDYIGMESCLDLKDNDDVFYTSSSWDDNNDHEAEAKEEEEKGCSGQRCSKRDQRLAEMMKKKREREIPPPIPSLARTENLHSHMPWVLKRYYTSDGRLILKKEKVRHHEYFKAHRSNCRLTLQLVSLDDDYLDISFDDDGNDTHHSLFEIPNDDGGEKVEQEAVDDNDDFDDCDIKVNANDDERMVNESDMKMVMSSSSPVVEPSSMENGFGGGNGAGKCLNYNNVTASSSCFLGMPVPTIRPVHS